MRQYVAYAKLITSTNRIGAQTEPLQMGGIVFPGGTVAVV